VSGRLRARRGAKQADRAVFQCSVERFLQRTNKTNQELAGMVPDGVCSRGEEAACSPVFWNLRIARVEGDQAGNSRSYCFWKSLCDLPAVLDFEVRSTLLTTSRSDPTGARSRACEELANLLELVARYGRCRTSPEAVKGVCVTHGLVGRD
jgi:hypothetical protein